MRAGRYAFVGLLFASALASSGCRTRPCKDGTVFVDLVYEGSAAMANSATLELQIDSGQINKKKIVHTPSAGSETLQIDFPGGYPKAGAVLHVTVEALVDTIVVGEAMKDITIESGCTRTVLAIGGADLAGIDLAGVTPPDLAQATIGGPCSDTSGCLAGTCVDHVCCATACADQCAACDVPGHEGMCTAVTGPPHGTRATCGTSPCTGTCDGTMTTQCRYPTNVTCGAAASCTSGVETPVGMCMEGACIQSKMSCLDNLCGTDNACNTVVQLAMGFNFGCALFSDTTVWCWGWNNVGQLGNGSSDNTTSHKPAPVPNLTGVTAIAAGDEHACAIMSDQTVKCWGRNTYGQLARGTVDATEVANPTPQAICQSGSGAGCSTLPKVSKIAAGGDTTCVIASFNNNNDVFCWGYGADGEMGNGGTTQNNPNPVATCAPLNTGCSQHFLESNGGAMDISVGYAVVCAVDGNTGANSAYCWGYNNAGQTGAPLTTANSLYPFGVPGVSVGTLVPTSVTAGRYVSFAIISDGTAAHNQVRAWGNGGAGARGGGTASVTNVGPNVTSVCTADPCTATNNLTGATALAATYGSSSSSACAVVNGAVYCWGPNDFGQLGKGDVTLTNPDYVTFATPSLVTAGATTIASDGGGGTAVCAALSTNHQTLCWGDDSNGALGDGGGTGASNSKGTPQPESW